MYTKEKHTELAFHEDICVVRKYAQNPFISKDPKIHEHLAFHEDFIVDALYKLNMKIWTIR